MIPTFTAKNTTPICRHEFCSECRQLTYSYFRVYEFFSPLLVHYRQTDYRQKVVHMSPSCKRAQILKFHIFSEIALKEIDDYITAGTE